MPLPFQLDATAKNIVSVPPPMRFREVVGLRDVWRAAGSGIAKKTEHTLAQTAGLRYERKVIASLSRLFGETDLEIRPWFGFRDANGNGHAQPDAVLRIAAEGRPRPYMPQIVIFEVKNLHTADAWWQLRKKYLPLVEHVSALTERAAAKPRLCEICSSFDPAVFFPEEIELFFDEEGFRFWLERPVADFGVWQMKV